MTWKGGYKIVEDLAGVDETVELLQRWHRAIHSCLDGIYDRVDRDYERKGD